jgi:hypothetical protein
MMFSTGANYLQAFCGHGYVVKWPVPIEALCKVVSEVSVVVIAF